MVWESDGEPVVSWDVFPVLSSRNNHNFLDSIHGQFGTHYRIHHNDDDLLRTGSPSNAHCGISNISHLRIDVMWAFLLVSGLVYAVPIIAVVI